MKRKLLIISLLPIIALSGCSSSGGESFDIVKFLSNPYVMIIGGVILAFWMFKHSK